MKSLCVCLCVCHFNIGSVSLQAIDTKFCRDPSFDNVDLSLFFQLKISPLGGTLLSTDFIRLLQ